MWLGGHVFIQKFNMAALWCYYGGLGLVILANIFILLVAFTSYKTNTSFSIVTGVLALGDFILNLIIIGLIAQAWTTTSLNIIGHDLLLAQRLLYGATAFLAAKLVVPFFVYLKEQNTIKK